MIRIILKIFSSRYLLAFTAFILWMLFFDEKNIFVQVERSNELAELNRKVDYYKNQLTTTSSQLLLIQNNPAELEKFAREKYFMKKENEDIFIFDTTQ